MYVALTLVQIVVPSENGQILSVPVHQFVAMIKVRRLVSLTDPHA